MKSNNKSVTASSNPVDSNVVKYLDAGTPDAEDNPDFLKEALDAALTDSEYFQKQLSECRAEVEELRKTKGITVIGGIAVCPHGFNPQGCGICDETEKLHARVQELEKAMQSVLAESRERYQCSRCEYIEQIAKRALDGGKE